MAVRTEEMADGFGFAEWQGMSRALLAWVAWQEERFGEAERLAEGALERWKTNVVHDPLYWICLWPLIAVRLAGGHSKEAVAAARDLLGPDQMRLPAELEAKVEAAISAWDTGQAEVAAEQLALALKLAEELDFA